MCLTVPILFGVFLRVVGVDYSKQIQWIPFRSDFLAQPAGAEYKINSDEPPNEFFLARFTMSADDIYIGMYDKAAKLFTFLMDDGRIYTFEAGAAVEVSVFVI